MSDEEPAHRPGAVCGRPHCVCARPGRPCHEWAGDADTGPWCPCCGWNEVAHQPGAVDLGDWCCWAMRVYSTLSCGIHERRLDCPDVLVVWSERREPGLPVRDGGGSQVVIRWCPWCGADQVARRA